MSDPHWTSESAAVTRSMHNCMVPSHVGELRADESAAVMYHRCEGCGQKWKLHVGHSTQRGEQVGLRRAWHRDAWWNRLLRRFGR